MEILCAKTAPGVDHQGNADAHALVPMVAVNHAPALPAFWPPVIPLPAALNAASFQRPVATIAAAQAGGSSFVYALDLAEAADTLARERFVANPGDDFKVVRAEKRKWVERLRNACLPNGMGMIKPSALHQDRKERSLDMARMLKVEKICEGAPQQVNKFALMLVVGLAPHEHQ